MNIFVVVLNWNGKEFLQQCIESLLDQTLINKIIVVDNGSTDESINIIESKNLRLKIIRNDRNLGFSGGVNKGIEYAMESGADFVALLNNDAIADKNWLKELVKAAAETEAGIITSRLKKIHSENLDSSGEFYSIFGLPFPRGRGKKDTNQFDNDTTIFGASGGASLYSVKMLREIGLFDEDYFAYFEDVDISFRAQLAGWKIFYAPKAVAYHHIGGTSSKINGFATYQTAKNFWYVYTKNMPDYLYFKYLPLAVYWYYRMFAARLIKGGFVAFAKGWIVSILFTPKKILQRIKIQRKRKVSISYIDSILYHGRPPKV